MIQRQNRRRLPIQPADDVVILGGEFHSGDVLESDDRAIRVGAQDDFPELLLRLEAALGANRVSKFLSWRHRQAADAPGGIDGILVVHRADNLRHGDVEGGQLGRLDPEAHGVLARAENNHLRDTGHAGERVVQIDVGVIGQELRVASAIG